MELSGILTVQALCVSSWALNWQPQTDTMVKKLSACLGALKEVRDYAPHQALIRMYEALILPYFDYCSEVWGCLGKCLSSRLQKL